MLREAKLGIMLALLLTCMLGIILTGLPLAEASPTTVVSVEPVSIVDAALVPGSVFRINITVADVQNLWGYQLVLSYDTSVLTATGFGLFSPFLDFLPSLINDSAGYVAMAAYTFFGDSVGLTTVDPAPIGWIQFVVDSVGTSVLHLSGGWPPTGYYEPTVLLANVFGEVIPNVDVDGFFDNRPAVSLSISVDVDPDTLNVDSEGEWITAYLQLPGGYFAGDIDASTILLNGTIQPVLDPTYGFVTNSSQYLVDHNNDGIIERMVKFDRASVESLIGSQGIGIGNAVLVITGQLNDGTQFEGTDIIYVGQAY